MILTAIGRIHFGIDGADDYFNIKQGNLDELTEEAVAQYFMEEFYQETYQEAGGYFCKTYKFLRINESEGVLIVHGRYDV